METNETGSRLSGILIVRGPSRYDILMSLFEKKRISFKAELDLEWSFVVEGAMEGTPTPEDWTSDWWNLSGMDVIPPRGYYGEFPPLYGRLYMKFNPRLRKGFASFMLPEDRNVRLLSRTWDSLCDGSTLS